MVQDCFDMKDCQIDAIRGRQQVVSVGLHKCKTCDKASSLVALLEKHEPAV